MPPCAVKFTVTALMSFGRKKPATRESRALPGRRNRGRHTLGGSQRARSWRDAAGARSYCDPGDHHARLSCSDACAGLADGRADQSGGEEAVKTSPRRGHARLTPRERARQRQGFTRSVLSVGRSQFLGAGQNADETSGIVNQHRQMLRPEADGRAAVLECQEWRRVRAALTKETGSFFHRMNVPRRICYFRT